MSPRVMVVAVLQVACFSVLSAVIADRLGVVTMLAIAGAAETAVLAYLWITRERSRSVE